MKNEKMQLNTDVVRMLGIQDGARELEHLATRMQYTNILHEVMAILFTIVFEAPAEATRKTS